MRSVLLVCVVGLVLQCGSMVLGQGGGRAGVAPEIAEVRAQIDATDQYRALEQLDAILKANPRNAAAYFVRGNLYSDSIDFMADRAEADFRRAVELAPANASYHQRLGAALRARGKFADAIAEYAESLRRDPANLALLTELGELAAAREMWPESLAALESVEKSLPAGAPGANSPAAKFRATLVGFQAMALKGSRQDADAEAAIKRAAEFDTNVAANFSTHLLLMANRASILTKRIESDMQREDWAAALEGCDQALKYWASQPLKPKIITQPLPAVRINPPADETLSLDIAHVQVQRAKCLAAMLLAGKPGLEPQIDEALAAADAVVPVRKEGHAYILAEFRKQLQADRSLSTADRLARAQALFDRREKGPFASADIERAWKDLALVLKDNPREGRAYSMRSWLAIQRRTRPDFQTMALIEANRGMALKPPTAAEYEWRASLHANLAQAVLGKIDEPHLDLALSDLKQAIELAPRDPGPYKMRAHLLTISNRGTPEQLIADYDKILEINPREVGIVNQRNSAYLKAGRFAEAEKSLAAEVEKDQNNAFLRMMHAKALAGLERYPEAVAEFQKAAVNSSLAKEANAQIKAIQDRAK